MQSRPDVLSVLVILAVAVLTSGSAASCSRWLPSRGLSKSKFRMSYEKLEPHGRLTIAAAEFAWDFYMRTSVLNNDQDGNAVVTPTLVQYQMAMMTVMSSGETKKQLLRTMHLRDDEYVTEFMRWMLWTIDYFMREVALSYGTKPRSFLVIARNVPLNYNINILQWVNHYRTRKSYHVVPTLKGSERQVNSIIRRLTGAYPRDLTYEDMFPLDTFKDDTRAIVATKMHFQLFVPSSGSLTQVSDYRVAFWRTPVDNNEAQGEEKLGKVRLLRMIKKFEYLEDEHCEMVGIDLYPANLSAYFMLPKEAYALDGTLLNVNQALLLLERKLDGRVLHNYMQKLLPQRTKRTTEMMVTLPVFLLHTDADLEQPMKNLGMASLFDPKNKDWTNLFNDMNPEGGDFYLSIAKQSISVLLQPTSLASNYYLQMNPSKKKFPTDWNGQQITFNRPFLFFIYDHFTRVFLVFGRCQNPCEKREP